MRSILPLSLLCLVACASTPSASDGTNAPAPPGTPGSTPDAPVTCPTAGPLETIIEEPGQFVSAFAVDDTHVYYTIETMDGTPTENVLKRVPIAGGAAEELAHTGRTLDIVTTADTIYWVASGDNRQDLWSLAKTGGTPAVVSDPDESPTRVAIGPSNAVLYDTYPGGQILRRAKIGAAPETLASVTRDYLGSFLLDGDSLFVTQVSAQDQNGYVGDTSLYVQPIGGGGADKTIYGPFQKDSLGALAVDHDNVYVGHGTQIAKMPKAGGDPVFIDTEAEAEARGNVMVGGAFELLVDSESLYWLEMNIVSSPMTGNVVRKKKTGAPREVIGTGALPKNLRLDACHVYWAEEGDHAMSIVRHGK